MSDNVRHIGRPITFAEMELPAPEAPPKGPFTVSVAGPDGPMFEVVFPDHRGDLPPGASVLGTAGQTEVLVDLLTGALRVFAGRVDR